MGMRLRFGSKCEETGGKVRCDDFVYMEKTKLFISDI